MENKTAYLDPTTRYGLIILAITQGYSLYFLHLAVNAEVWPATDYRWLKALYTVAIALPAFFYLGVERIKDRRNLGAAIALSPLLFLLGWHLGWVEQTQNIASRHQHEFTPPFVFSVGVALFILAFFYRFWSAVATWRFDYNKILALSWQHALTLALLGLFIGVFWMLLMLWGALFDAVGVGFFKELFREPAFVYPVTWLVLGMGLALIRGRIRLVATVQFMCEALIKALLPLAAFIAVLFLSMLPFIGLQPIWDTGKAAAMMMALSLVLLFFFNAVFNGSSEQAPYPTPLRLFVLATVALLPIHTLLATWSLWLRINQYGLTPDRLWAGTLLLLIAGYTFSYCAMILWKRLHSLSMIQTANICLALFSATVLILVNTPLADFRHWSAQSQKARLLSGEVEPQKFDYAYMRFSLGTYGVKALEEIKQSELAQRHPEVAKRIEAAMKQDHRGSNAPIAEADDPAAIVGLLHVTPANADLPDELAKLIAKEQTACLNQSNHCRAVKLPYSSDGADWLVHYSGQRRGGLAYKKIDQQWLKMGSFYPKSCSEEPEESMSDILVRMPGPFLAYMQGSCIYPVSPDVAYLRQYAEQNTQRD